jgi:hypothetical protein
MPSLALRRRAGWLALLAALPLMVLARVALPTAAPPLYDGIVIIDPYRFLEPPLFGGLGDPTTIRERFGVVDDHLPGLAVATEESPPQAQLVAPEDAFILESGLVEVTIEPVKPVSNVDGKAFAGNVYRFTVTSFEGEELVPDLPVTVILRAPGDPPEAQIAVHSGGAWSLLPTDVGAHAGSFVTETDVLGDFAVVVPPDFNLVVTLALIALGVVGAGAWIIRDTRRGRARRAAAAASAGGPSSGSGPSPTRSRPPEAAVSGPAPRPIGPKPGRAGRPTISRRSRVRGSGPAPEPGTRPPEERPPRPSNAPRPPRPRKPPEGGA